VGVLHGTTWRQEHRYLDVLSTYYIRVFDAQEGILCWAILKLLYLEYQQAFALENSVFLNVMRCSLMEIYKHLGGTSRLQLWTHVHVKIEAARFSETSLHLQRKISQRFSSSKKFDL
jgi:hypothetical protein